MKNHTNNSKIIIVGKMVWDQCGHCKALVPEWNKMKKYIRTISKNTPGVFYRFVEIKAGDKEQDHINKINNKYLMNSEEKLGVQGGYPTLFKIKDNKLVYFNGGSRHSEELKKFYLEKNINGGNQEDMNEAMRETEETTGKLDDKIESQKTDGEHSKREKNKSFLNKIMGFFGGRKTQKRQKKQNRKTQKRQ